MCMRTLNVNTVCIALYFIRGYGIRGESSLATYAGLEPATSAVTGRRANQLRYGAKI